MATRPEIQIVSGKLAGKRYTVKSGGLRLGRSSSNDICVPDAELSRNHCLFETVGDSGVRIIDLASANGTYLNGKPLGSDPVEVKAGDLVEVGETVLKIVGETPAVSGEAVDLGLGNDAPAVPKAPAEKEKTSLLRWMLWLVVLVSLAGTAYVWWMTKNGNTAETTPAPIGEEEPVLKEAYYEKVEANAEGIYRYELALNGDGVLSVTVDDVPRERRHVNKSKPLSAVAMKELGDILAFKNLREIDREYAGADPEGPTLESWTLRVVYDQRVRRIKIVNTEEPEAFRAVREKLEAFSKNELGVWAIQYSRDKLVELAEASIQLGETKWEDREVQHGNLFESVKAFKEALFYLETIDPKPECATRAREGLKKATEELETRYADQRFQADRAINLGQWETAKRELVTLMELIPDREDDRNREASAKLIDVEKRLKGGR